MSSLGWSVLGGVLIGLSVTALFVWNGKIAGISGIVAEVLTPGEGVPWRPAFLLGMVLTGAAFVAWGPQWMSSSQSLSTPVLVVAGLMVGFGTRLGSGCTSGHGVCGLSRFSLRSLVATLTFIATGALTVWFVSRGGAR